MDDWVRRAAVLATTVMTATSGATLAAPDGWSEPDAVFPAEPGIHEPCEAGLTSDSATPPWSGATGAVDLGVTTDVLASAGGDLLSVSTRRRRALGAGADWVDQAALQAATVLRAAAEAQIAPVEIGTTVEGGYALWFSTGEFYAVVECYDEGDVAVLWKHPENGLGNWVVGDEFDLTESLRHLIGFLDHPVEASSAA